MTPTSKTALLDRRRLRGVGYGRVQANLRDRIVAVGRRLVDDRLVVEPAGNVSARFADGFLITPTRQAYSTMAPDDVVEVSAGGGSLDSAGGEPSSELLLHATIYAMRRDVNAIVHTHSVHATAWSFLGRPLAPELEDNAYFGIGTVRTAPYGPSGSPSAARAASETLAASGAVLLARHGVIAVGATLREAFARAAVVERQSQVAWLLSTRPSSTGLAGLDSRQGSGVTKEH